MQHTVPNTRDDLWAAVHAERAALAADLATATAEQWSRPSLCGRWTVEDVIAHLSAAASTGTVAWLRSMVGARFDADLHNLRRLAEQRGGTPAETLARFRALIPSTTGPTRQTAAWLGEVVVHAEDVRRPLGLSSPTPVSTVTAVAEFFARRDFAVNSRSVAKGLGLRATDGPFGSGDGPEVRGTTLALTMAMAGRHGYLEELRGPGLETLTERVDRGRRISNGRHPITD